MSSRDSELLRLVCPNCLEEELYYDNVRRMFICLNPQCQKRYVLAEYRNKGEE